MGQDITRHIELPFGFHIHLPISRNGREPIEDLRASIYFSLGQDFRDRPFARNTIDKENRWDANTRGKAAELERY